MNEIKFTYDLASLAYPFVQEITVPRGARGILTVRGTVSRDVSYAITAHVAEGASLTVDDFIETSAHCKAALAVLLEGKGASLTDNSRYHGRGTAQFEIERAVVHTGAETVSHLEARGVVEETARAVWRGRIRVEKSAQKAHAVQNHHALLAGAKAYMDASPVLEIFTNDVVCSHSASVTRVKNESLFYLQSRGVPRKEAEQHIINGFLYG